MTERDYASVQSFLVFILHHLEYDHDNDEARELAIYELKQWLGLYEPEEQETASQPVQDVA